MESNKNLSISTVSVDIKVIKVDGKRMSKAVFNQIQIADPFSAQFDFYGDCILGYVVDDYCRQLMFTSDGELRKVRLGGLYDFISKDFNINKGRLYYSSNDHLSHTCIDEKLYNITKSGWLLTEECQNKIRTFLNSIEGNQIYIAI